MPDMQNAALAGRSRQEAAAAPAPAPAAEAEPMPSAKLVSEDSHDGDKREKYRVGPSTTLEILEAPDHFSLGYDRVLPAPHNLTFQRIRAAGKNLSPPLKAWRKM